MGNHFLLILLIVVPTGRPNRESDVNPINQKTPIDIKQPCSLKGKAYGKILLTVEFADIPVRPARTNG